MIKLNNRKDKQEHIPWVITLFIVAGIAFAYVFYEYIGDLKKLDKDNITYTNQLLSILSICFTAITIYLLYKNFDQQKKEFTRINEESVRANDLQVILFEKQIIDKNLSELKTLKGEKYFDDAVLHLYSFFKDLNNEHIDEEGFSVEMKKANDYKIQVLNFFVLLNAKVTYLSQVLNNEKSIMLLTESIGYKQIELLNAFYKKNAVFQYKRFQGLTKGFRIGSTESTFYIKLDYIINETPIIKKMVESYMELVGYNKYES